MKSEKLRHAVVDACWDCKQQEVKKPKTTDRYNQQFEIGKRGTEFMQLDTVHFQR